jgi:hypothetical protein
MKLKNVGEINVNRFGSLMKIVEYNNYKNIWVEFLDYGNLVNTQYDKFINGKVRNVYDRSVFGVGYIGEGKYKVSENGIETKVYPIWKSMIKRCYSEKWLKEHPSYIECAVSEEWLNFQNFAQWYNENHYEVDGEKMCLDKDILVKGNKIYSSDTCIITPERINNLFVKANSKRGELPIGVSWNSYHKKYQSNIKHSKLNNYFSAPEEAFDSYKIHKEKLIRQIANEYKERIPAILYNTLMTYKVEITD